MVLATLGIATGRHDPSLHPAHPGIGVDRRRECLGGEVLLGKMIKRLGGVDEHAVSTHRSHDRHSGLEEHVAQVLDLTDSCSNMIVGRHHFPDSSGECFHIPAGHPAVGVQPLEGH